MSNEMTYEIGGKTFVQKKLVLGQTRQLINVLKGVEFPNGTRVSQIVDILGDRLPEALAVVLVEQGKRPKDKNVTELAEWFDETMDLETAARAVGDFFDCNPILSVIETLTGSMGKITKAIPEIGLNRPSSSSPRATSRKKKKSPGATRRKR